MRKVLATAAVLALAAAPLSAQQAEKSPFAAPADAGLATAPAPRAESAPAERPASLVITRQQMDEAVRNQEQLRGERVTLDRNFWYLVGAVALGVIIASVII